MAPAAPMELPPRDRLASLVDPPPHQFSARELHSLDAICDTLLPIIPGHVEASLELLEKLPNWVAGTMSLRLKAEKVRQVRGVLWLLSTRLGTLLLLGLWACTPAFPWVHPFAALPPKRRERALLSWSSSRIGALRALFKAFKAFCCSLYASLLDSSGHNPLLDALDYCPPGLKASAPSSPTSPTSPTSGPMDASSSGSDTSEGAPSGDPKEEGPAGGQEEPAPPLHGAHLAPSQSPSPSPSIRSSVVDAAAMSREKLQEEMESRGFTCCHVDTPGGLREVEERVGPLPELDAAGTGQGGDLLLVACDAVVVGSGCGGAVVAARLASARPGSRILILDKGRYYQGQDFKQLEAPAMAELFEGGGFLATEDGSVSVLAGTCVGGGSIINWSASFRTPPHVRREWAQEYGLTHFDGAEFDEALDAVCQRIGVNSDNDKHSLSNLVLQLGCTQLGYPCNNIPLNAPAPHSCGWCTFGCRDGGKQSTACTWLADAAQQGAVVLSSARAQRVLLQPHSPPQGHPEAEGRRHRVAGVLVEADSGAHPAPAGHRTRLIAEAPLVVVACGSLHTPALLLRSGLRNRNIGRHLRVHPVCSAWGFFPEEDASLRRKLPGRSPEGGMMTLFSNVVGNWDTSGYGAIIQTPCVHPGLGGGVFAWHSKAEFQEMLLKYPRVAPLMAIARDTGRGRVYLDGKGQLALDYDVNARDSRSLMDGIKAMLRILRAAGAHQVGTNHQAHRQIFDCTQQHTEREFEGFLETVEREGVGKNEVPVFSAHQLGSCPMGLSPRVSAVDAQGEAWEARGLFLGDASLLPSPSGVNPMVTVEAVAYLVGSRLAKRFSKGEFDSEKVASSSQTHEANSIA